MYGRANTELLRARMWPILPPWSMRYEAEPPKMAPDSASRAAAFSRFAGKNRPWNKDVDLQGALHSVIAPGPVWTRNYSFEESSFGFGYLRMAEDRVRWRTARSRERRRIIPPIEVRPRIDRVARRLGRSVLRSRSGTSRNRSRLSAARQQRRRLRNPASPPRRSRRVRRRSRRRRWARGRAPRRLADPQGVASDPRARWARRGARRARSGLRPPARAWRRAPPRKSHPRKRRNGVGRPPRRDRRLSRHPHRG